MTAIETTEAGERTQKEFVRYIDMTPSWIGVLPILIETKDHPDSRKELEKMAKLADRLNTPLHEAAPEMLEALRQVQIALACDRDGQKYADPKGRELCLEEVKYCIVDPAIAKAEGRAQ